MNKMDELKELLNANVVKVNELLNKKEAEEEKKKSKVLCVFAVIGVIAAIAAAAYGIYRFFAPDYLDGMLKPAEKQRFLEVLQNDILHLTTEQSGELVEVFERLRKYYNRHDAVAEKLKQNYCLELLLLCRDYYTRQERTQMPELSAAPRQEILDAIAYINAHYAEKIDLETIASQIHLSKYYFCRIFREVTGATVLEYLTNVRLTRAGRLLVESSLAIQEIAQKTGFASLVHFSRTYRNAYGVSPSDTRRRRKA